MATESQNIVADNIEYKDELENLKLVNGLKKRVNGDLLDGHSFTIGFLIESLRINDEEYKRLHGNRPVKNVSSKITSF